MVDWGWLIVAFYIGIFVGVFVLGLFANSKQPEKGNKNERL
jgi:hypothetical protein